MIRCELDHWREHGLECEQTAAVDVVLGGGRGGGGGGGRFFFNDTATTEIYTLSLHDALRSEGPGIWVQQSTRKRSSLTFVCSYPPLGASLGTTCRSEEHTSELQSLVNLVCRLLLEKKKPVSESLFASCCVPGPS